MGSAQIILLCLINLNLLAASYMHGKPKTGTHSLWTTVIGNAIVLWILIAGGFFK